MRVLSYLMFILSSGRLPSMKSDFNNSRNGKNSSDLYSWGNKLIENKQYKANVWQEAQFDILSADGFTSVSPVGFFGSIAVGLIDMGVMPGFSN